MWASSSLYGCFSIHIFNMMAIHKVRSLGIFFIFVRCIAWHQEENPALRCLLFSLMCSGRDILKISHCNSIQFLDILDSISAGCFYYRHLPSGTSTMALAHHFHQVSSEYSYTNAEIPSRRYPYRKQNQSYSAWSLDTPEEYLCSCASREISKRGHRVHHWSACWLRGCDSCQHMVASISS